MRKTRVAEARRIQERRGEDGTRITGSIAVVKCQRDGT